VTAALDFFFFVPINSKDEEKEINGDTEVRGEKKNSASKEKKQ
jgi:hypothetical protein